MKKKSKLSELNA